LQELYLIINKKYFFLILFLFQFSYYGQTDWVRWEKSNPNYQIKDSFLERDYDLSITSVQDVIVKPLINSYWFFISDVDGANCPFQPSCSSFLVQSIKETNFLQGVVMFFDRFTRDTNIFNRRNHYPFFDKNHFYDPITLYTLDTEKIKIIPVNTIVNE
jgi:putative component of membrane protein insertase Oxa1/YidC/SpoIIIJ protein YidD